MAGRQHDRQGWVDWPTLAAIALFWLALVAVAAGIASDHVPAAAAVVVLAVLGGFHMSLQHEVIHGHPTRFPLLNRALVAIPLGLVQPYSRYRAIHIGHHASDLTDPDDDPESFYVSAEDWQRAGRLQRAYLRANRTLAFRLTVGPFVAVWRTIHFDARKAPNDLAVAIAWVVHIVGCAAVIVALREIGVPLWVYLLGFVYGGNALTALRSFAEHRAVADGPRSAVVRAGWFFSLLYLNNNLHYTHHQLPGAAWYRLPELTEALDAGAVVAEYAGTYPGYWSLMRRHMFTGFDQPVHPLSDTISA